MELVETQPPDEVRELQEELYSLKKLLQDRTFKLFIEVLEAQVKTRSDTLLLKPLERMDDVLHQEFSKGEIAGLTLAVRFVEIRISDLEEQIDEILNEQRENDNEPSDENSTGFDGSELG